MPPSSESDDRVQAGEEQSRQAKPSRSLKLNGPVRLESYDAEWPRLYEREAARIRSVLGNRVLLLEHVGSTSVPGLAAKPVIDILLVVADPAEEAAYIPDLELKGYRLVARHPAVPAPHAGRARHGYQPARPPAGKHGNGKNAALPRSPARQRSRP